MAFVIVWNDGTLGIARNPRHLAELLAGKIDDCRCLHPAENEAEAVNVLNGLLLKLE